MQRRKCFGTKGALDADAADAATAFGGMLMKFVKTFCLVAFVAIAAAATHAGSIGSDPKITVSKPGGPGGGVAHDAHPLICIGTCFNKNSESDPLIVNGNNLATFDFTWTGTHDLTKLWIEVNPFTCGTCYVGDTTGPLSVFTMWRPDFGHSFPEFEFYGGGGLTPGENFVVGVTPLVGTPEPSTLLLFLSMGPAIGFARKRWLGKSA